MTKTPLALLSCALFALCACEEVPREWARYPTKEATVGQTTFTVHQNGPYVLARQSSGKRYISWRAVAPSAALAIERATGCDFEQNTMRGDAVLMTALVRCGNDTEVDRILEERRKENERYEQEQRIIDGVATRIYENSLLNR